MRTREAISQGLTSTTVTIDRPSLPALSTTQRAENFLATVSNRYIAAMRNASQSAGEVLYGGDIELIEIAQILNVRIIVNRYLAYTARQGLMIEPQPAIGPARAPIIQLLLVGRHYQICLPLPSGKLKFSDNIPGDGSCLFHACIRAKKLLEAGSDDFAVATSTLAEAAILRGQVCDRLQARQAAIARGDSEEREDVIGGRARLTQYDDSIRSHFAAVLEAVDQEQLYLATDGLPDGELLREARAIKHALSPGLRFTRRIAAQKTKTLAKPAVSKPQAEQESRSSQSSIEQQVDLVPAVTPLSTTAKVVAKPLKLDPSVIAMRRNTTLPKATNGIDFRVERVVGETLSFRVSIIRQLGERIEELTNLIEAGREIGIPVLPKAGVQVERDGTFHLVGDWPWDFNYEFATDGDICIDKLNSTGKIKINARKLKSHAPIQAKELELHATEELTIPELSVNSSVVIHYAGEQAHYHCGPIISRGTVEITCPNCNLEQVSNIDARGVINLTAQEVIINGAAITSYTGNINLTSTKRDSSYSIINRGTLQAEGKVKFTGQGLSQEGMLTANDDFIFEVLNLNLQQKIACGGSIDCELPGEFIQAVGASITVGGTFKIRATRSMQTWAPIEANGKLTLVIADAPRAVLETNGALISHSVEGLEIRVPSFINHSDWKTTRGGMLIITTMLLSAEVSRNLGSISCVGDFCIDTTGLLLERGSFKTNGNFIINSPSLRLVITSPCEVGGDLRASNVLAGDFAYSADAIKVNGTLLLKFAGDSLTVLESPINTPGNIELEVATSSNKLLRLAAPIKANGWVKLIAPELETTSTIEARGTIELASTATGKTYTITNTGTIRTATGHITIHGQGLTHTEGLIASNADLVIAVQHVNLIRPCTAVGKLEVTVPQTFIYTADTFIAGSVEIIRANAFAITTPLNNPGGGLVLIIQAGAVADVQVQAPVKASGGVKIVTSTRLVVGQSGTLQEISAGGVLQLEASKIDNSWGRLFGQRGVYLKSAGEIANGEVVVMKKEYDVFKHFDIHGYEVPSGWEVHHEDDFHNPNGALIASGDYLQVEGMELHNRHGEIYIARNFNTATLRRFINIGGIFSCHGNANFSRTNIENKISYIRVLFAADNIHLIIEHPSSNAPLIEIGGNADFADISNYGGNINIAGVSRYLCPEHIFNIPINTTYTVHTTGTIHHVNQKLDQFIKSAVPITYLIRGGVRSLSPSSGNYYVRIKLISMMRTIVQKSIHAASMHANCSNSTCPVCRVQTLETYGGILSSGKTINIIPKTLTFLGAVSSPHIEITGFSSAIIGAADASIQLFPSKPFQPVHRLIDYARSSGLFRVAGSTSSTIMELTIPLQYEPNLKPAVVITPTGFALNYKNLKLLYPPFAERQYITEILMSALKRGYLDDKCTTPEQIHYKLRSEAFHVYEQFTNMPGSGVTTLPEKLARATITEPVLVYQELEYQGPNGKETILSPVVWFPKSYDNPYARNGMGLMYGNQIYILGDLEKGSTLYINACIQATKTLAAACRDEFTMSGIVQGENTTLASFEKNVEIASRVTRIQRYNGYDDVIFRARAEARDTLAIAARKKDVVFQDAETHSGVRTDIQAGRAILDVPLALTHHSIQYVHDEDTYGIITDTHIEQCVSKHSSGDGVTTGAITMNAGDSARLYAPEFESHTAEIASATGRSEVLDVTESHQHEAHITEESSSWFGSDKEIHSVSVSETSKGAQFRVKRLTLAGKTGVKVKHIHSAADVTRFSAPGATVAIEQGENRSQSSYSSHSSGLFWQSSKVEQSSHVTYSPSTFAGTIEVDAKTLQVEEVRDTTLEFLQRIVQSNATIQRTVLTEEHHYESESHSGPIVGLAALVSLAAGIVTNGLGAQLLSKLSSVIGEAAVNAGFSALCAKTSVSLLANGGDPGKALASLIKEETVRELATAMLSAGILAKVADSLKLPKEFAKKTSIQHLEYNLARASIGAALNVSINGESLDKALQGGLVDAAVGTVSGIAAQRVGELYGTAKLDPVTHKLAHGLIGGLSGLVLKGEKGFTGGALGAIIAETMAEALQPEELAMARAAQALEVEKGRKLTLEEYQELRCSFGIEVERDSETLLQASQKAADYAKLTAGAGALLLHQDVSLAALTAATALENNFMQNAALHAAYYRYLEHGSTTVELDGGVEDSAEEHPLSDGVEFEAEPLSVSIGEDFVTTPDYTGVNLGELPPVSIATEMGLRRARVARPGVSSRKADKQIALKCKTLRPRIPTDTELLQAFIADMPASTRKKALANEGTREILLRRAKGVYILTHGTERQRQQLIASMNKSSSGHAITTWKGAITNAASSFNGMGAITLETAGIVGLVTAPEMVWGLGKVCTWGYRAYRSGELAVAVSGVMPKGWRLVGGKATGRAGQAVSIADAQRLVVELHLKEAGILTRDGRLTEVAIDKASAIPIREIKNTSVIKALTKDGSLIQNWKKFASPSVELPNGQRIRIHFYKNTKTGKVDYTHHDFKVKGIVEPVHGRATSIDSTPVTVYERGRKAATKLASTQEEILQVLEESASNGGVNSSSTAAAKPKQ